MRKQDGKIIRALIKRVIGYLSQKPKPPPMKCVFLAKMYEIESAVDIAVNYSYNNQTSKRKRGIWQWYNVDLRTLSKKDKKTTNDSEEEKKEEKKKEDEDNKNEKKKEEKKGEWITFPLSISDQIEATYLKLLADLVCIILVFFVCFFFTFFNSFG